MQERIHSVLKSIGIVNKSVKLLQITLRKTETVVKIRGKLLGKSKEDELIAL